MEDASGRNRAENDKGKRLAAACLYLHIIINAFAANGICAFDASGRKFGIFDEKNDLNIYRSISETSRYSSQSPALLRQK